MKHRQKLFQHLENNIEIFKKSFFSPKSWEMDILQNPENFTMKLASLYCICISILLYSIIILQIASSCSL